MGSIGVELLLEARGLSVGLDGADRAGEVVLLPKGTSEDTVHAPMWVFSQSSVSFHAAMAAASL
jgi:hypothetical protein